MKTIIKITLSLLFLSGLFAQDRKGQKINLTIEGFGSDEGVVMIALFNSKSGYEGSGKPYVGVSAKIKNKKTQHIFENLPAGEYAIKLFHDENNNGELDTGLFGIPTESYAFSNNASGTFGPASYEDAKFIIKQEDVAQNLKVN